MNSNVLQVALCTVTGAYASYPRMKILHEEMIEGKSVRVPGSEPAMTTSRLNPLPLLFLSCEGLKLNELEALFRVMSCLRMYNQS